MNEASDSCSTGQGAVSYERVTGIGDKVRLEGGRGTVEERLVCGPGNGVIINKDAS